MSFYKNMSQQFYYLDESNSVIGPATPVAIGKLVAEGVLSENSLLCAEGKQEWTPVSQVSSLEEFLPPSPSDLSPPPPPPPPSQPASPIPSPSDELPPIPEDSPPITFEDGLPDLPADTEVETNSLDDQPGEEPETIVKASFSEKLSGWVVGLLCAGGFLIIRLIIYKYFADSPPTP